MRHIELEDADELLEEYSRKSLNCLYGDKPPVELQKRLDDELDIITSRGNSVYYLLAIAMADACTAQGYSFYYSGHVTSALVAFLNGMTDIHPMGAGYQGEGIFIPFEVTGEQYGYYPNFEFFTAPSAIHLIRDDLAERFEDYKPVLLTIDEPGIPVYYRMIFVPKPSSWMAEGLDGYDAVNLYPDERLEELFRYHREHCHEPRPLRPYTSDEIRRIWGYLLEHDETHDIPETMREISGNINTYEELVVAAGIAFSTGIWDENLKKEIISGELPLEQAIATRDDLYMCLVRCGCNPKEAFDIMTRTRRGWPLLETDEALMESRGVPAHVISLCNRADYLSSRALITQKLEYYKKLDEMWKGET